MVKKLFVNLPVKDLKTSVEFFTKLGFSFNPQFTDETATCMIVSDAIMVMLLTQAKFGQFTPKPPVDAKKNTEVLLALEVDSRAHVAELVQKAVAAGGSTYNDPKDHGFMLQHGFQDPDGHLWEVFYMDLDAFSQQQAKAS